MKKLLSNGWLYVVLALSVCVIILLIAFMNAQNTIKKGDLKNNYDYKRSLTYQFDKINEETNHNYKLFVNEYKNELIIIGEILNGTVNEEPASLVIDSIKKEIESYGNSKYTKLREIYFVQDDKVNPVHYYYYDVSNPNNIKLLNGGLYVCDDFAKEILDLANETLENNKTLDFFNNL